MPKARPGGVLLPTICLLLLPGYAGAATFTVTNTSDSGPGSLRQAILQANANPGADTIVFAIGSGLQTITPLAALPTVTDPVVLDGMSQPGYVGQPLIQISGGSAGPGSDGLTVTSGSTTIRGFVINGFQGAFLGGGGNGIVLQSGGANDVWGNYIGTDASGTAAVPNQGSGILIMNSSINRIQFLGPVSGLGNVISGNGIGIRILGSSNENHSGGNLVGVGITGLPIPNSGAGIIVGGGSGNLIGDGGTSQLRHIVSGNVGDGIQIVGPATGTLVVNVSVSGNGGNGVQVSGSSANTIGRLNDIVNNGANGVLLINGANGNLVFGNTIGVQASVPRSPAPNAFNGVIVSGSSGNTIGGTTRIDGNVISGNGTNGIRLRSGASGNLVLGNLIGTDATGTIAIANALEGVQINDAAAGNTVGGSAAGEGNLICGNSSNGVLIVDSTTMNNVVKGNQIGVTSSGQSLGNAIHGISVGSGASHNVIGDVGAGDANTIAFNGGAGVFVESGTGNSIRGNSIWGNGALGIDLAPTGVTANDHCDADTGANELQNFPTLTSASSLAGVTTVQGSVDAAASSSFTLDFYANTECDPSGHGQGRVWLGSAPISTDASCAAPFQVPLTTTTPVRFVTATATDSAGNTSEFSACIPVPAAFYSVAPCRLIDTRGQAGALGGPALSANADRSFPIAGQCGIPASAKAVALTVTVTQPTSQGDLRLYPGGGTLPNTSTVNYKAGQTRASNSVVVLGPSNDFVVRCVQASGSTHFVADVTGYFE